MARLDRIKNLTGLVGLVRRERPAARAGRTWWWSAGHIDPDASSPIAEERGEIERMHQLLDRARSWTGRCAGSAVSSSRPVAGELYRIVADRRGVFVQPALFEAFGLTVIEAMTSGLPTFATCYGGPPRSSSTACRASTSTPTTATEAAELIADFLERAADDPRAVAADLAGCASSRVEERYTWELYAERMMTLARVYGFWRVRDRAGAGRGERLYLQMLYDLKLRPLADAMAG